MVGGGGGVRPRTMRTLRTHFLTSVPELAPSSSSSHLLNRYRKQETISGHSRKLLLCRSGHILSEKQFPYFPHHKHNTHVHTRQGLTVSRTGMPSPPPPPIYIAYASLAGDRALRDALPVVMLCTLPCNRAPTFHLFIILLSVFVNFGWEVKYKNVCGGLPVLSVVR